MRHHRSRNLLWAALMMFECIALVSALYYSAFYLWLTATPQDSTRIRTLFYCFAFVSIASLIALCVTVAYRVRSASPDRLTAGGMCGGCGYDLTGLKAETCPECGRPHQS